MNRLLFLIDEVSTWVGKAFSWCILLLTFVVCYEVVSRYVFGAPTSWAYDTSYILYGSLFMMCGAYLLSRNGHVRGDFLYRTWKPRTQAGIDLLLYVTCFVPAALTLIYSGYGFAKMSWIMNEHSSFTPDGPPIYPFKTLIPVAGALLLLQGIAEMARCMICLRTGAWPQRLHDVEELEQIMLQQHAIQDDADRFAHEHAETSGGLR
ncbi:TRAP transporter small permease subunit [Aerophototrophica crusticola]|uniref:TRAP transporter small permease protein n=1 Tax=Aerophototrophica crusticola TaxID=1709002 RepID=A0A858R462_9PROT|nr:TRAP transporter small permease subunit [Rhodospirillaceae bacterium B3]